MFNRESSTRRWPSDSTLVDVSQEQEVQYWAHRLRVSSGMLKSTVRRVGAQFGDVAAAIEKKREEMPYVSHRADYRPPSWTVVHQARIEG